MAAKLSICDQTYLSSCMLILYFELAIDFMCLMHVFLQTVLLEVCTFFVCRAIKHLLDVLKPYSTENGGPLKVEHVVFVEGRGNLMIEYTSEGASGKLPISLFSLKIIQEPSIGG